MAATNFEDGKHLILMDGTSLRISGQYFDIDEPNDAVENAITEFNEANGEKVLYAYDAEFDYYFMAVSADDYEVATPEFDNLHARLGAFLALNHIIFE